MRNARECTLTAFIGLLLGLATGCGTGVVDPDAGNPLAPDEIVYADNLTILTDNSSLQLESLDGTTLRFSFSGSDAGVVTGDILSGSTGAPDGAYLRRVESIEQSSGGVLIINTAQATVDDAVDEGHFEHKILINPPDDSVSGKQQTVMQIGAAGEVDISGELFDNGLVTVDITSGTIGISAEIDWDVDFSLFGGLDSFPTTFDGAVELDLDVVVSAGAPGFYQYDVELLALPPQYFLVGIIAGQVNVIFEAGLEVDASAPGTVETGLDASADVELAGYYDSGGWSTSYDRSTDFNSHGWDWNLDGTVGARIFVRPKVEILFYYLAGPVFDLEPYLAFDADFDECFYDWALTGGVSSHLGIDLGALSDYAPPLPELELFDWNTIIASDQGSGCTYYLLTTSTQGCGSISPSGGSYEDGTVVTLSASACSGSGFDHWEGDATGSASTTSVVMTADRHVVAVFNEIPPTQYTLTTTVEGCGDVSPSGGVYDEGTIVVLIADACGEWSFDHWEGDASGTGSTATITMDGDRYVVGVFQEDPEPPDCTDDLACDDGDLCTIDSCPDGVCIHASVECPAGQTCDPASGICVGSPSPGMVFIPGGEFEMGCHAETGETCASFELPVHTVYLDSFYMDVYEVTNQQYADYLNSAYSQGLIEVINGVVYKAADSEPYCDTQSAGGNAEYGSRIHWDGDTFTVTAGKEDHPMVHVTWYGAVAYANWRSDQDGRMPCYDLSTWECDFDANGYRLPTEAEWEYAARGGEHDPYYAYPWGDTIDGSHANYHDSGDPYEDDWIYTTPVGYYNAGQSPAGADMANGYGLYDVSGNVWERCNDWYDSDYYDSNSYDNPQGPASGTHRIIRGGSWLSSSSLLRSGGRGADMPDFRSYSAGFRVASGT